MTTPTTVINRGIGQAICRLIIFKYNHPKLRLVATSRKGGDLGFGSEVLYPKLDVSDSRSIKALAEDVSQRGKVDVLINNAGINVDAQYGPQNAKRTLDVNYRSMLEMCQTFIPHLSTQGRVVNLSSVSSTLKPYSEQMRQRFRNLDMTLEDLEQLAQEFEHSVETNSEATAGFVGPGRSYAFSKSCVNAMTRILARDNPGLTINACCPGWVKTDMGLLIGRAPKTPEDGAKIPVHVALGDIGGVTGAYWANSSVRSKEEGQVQEW